MKKGKKTSASKKKSPKTKRTVYESILARIFKNHYKRGTKSFHFERKEIIEVAKQLGIELPKNVGDVLYSFRFRRELPVSITKTAPSGSEWIIKLAGRARYEMALSRINRIVPTENHFVTKIPDATPEIISKHALTDEQALLAKVRYNGLIDIFLRVTAFSLQNHLRTTVPDMGQVETDEIYVGIRN